MHRICRVFRVLAPLLSAFWLHSQALNRNLVANGDAESCPAAAQNATDPQVANIPNWTITGGFSAGSYGGGSFLSASDYIPVSHGSKFFYGGPGSKLATAVQTVDLSAAAANIDAGQVKFYLSGYLGFIGGSYDAINTISLKAEFQDASGNNLLVSTAAGPSTADVNVPAGLMLRIATGFLPANVRKAKVTVNLGTSSSGYNGFAADNISLVLTTDAQLGVNLLVNGDGETNPQSDNGYPVPGWNADTGLAVAKYGDYKMPTKTDPGPSDRGTYFFNCPTSHAQCRAYQGIDFTTAGKLVDAGKVSYTLSGWFGGDTGYPDNADMSVTFYDASGNAMGGAARIGPVNKGQRGLWQESTNATVPAGARAAQVNLYFHKLGPATDNLTAYADSLLFQLDAMQVTGVTNAASGQSGPVAPGQFVSIYGTSLGPATYQVAQGSQKGLGGTRVTFNGIEAFLTFTSANQVNALVPYGVAGKADVAVQYNGKTSDNFPLAVTDASPGIFTRQYGAGQAWAVNDDRVTFNTSSAPIARGGWITFWATGQGQVNPAGQDGEVLSSLKNVVLPVKVTIGGVEATLVAPAVLIYTGEVQVSVWIPNNAPTGDVPVVLSIGSGSSRKDVTISVK
ncbi:MAG TPA: IPT/TIG domain-containing protein [Candidatus Acidoferrales bacterium]|nr:IPT/TIG domain-containing protein [Candidatus Acidoferrales bacterium]